MNTAVYAERTARATDRMIEACQRIATVAGFEDVAELVANATHKDPAAKMLFQREVFAVVMERVADHLSPDTKPQPPEPAPDEGEGVQIPDPDSEVQDDDDTVTPKSSRAAHKAAAKKHH